MPANTAINATVAWAPLPPDLQCVPGDMNQLGPLIAQGLQISSSISPIDTGSSDSIAEQALTTANAALAQANAALAALPNFRYNDPQPVAAGDSTFAISWSPAFPDTRYIILGNYVSTAGAVAQFYNYHIVEGTQTPTGCTLRLDNTPANTTFGYLVFHAPAS
jgi:hypothetical protein